jgi:mono/diheme cytochrome c family protein
MKSAFVAWAGVLACATALALAASTEPPPTRAEFEKGENLFQAICAHCHGPHMVNPGTVAFDLRTFPHDDRTRFFHSVRNGKNNMPPWGDLFQAEDIEALWAYVMAGEKAK